MHRGWCASGGAIAPNRTACSAVSTSTTYWWSRKSSTPTTYRNRPPYRVPRVTHNCLARISNRVDEPDTGCRPRSAPSLGCLGWLSRRGRGARRDISPATRDGRRSPACHGRGTRQVSTGVLAAPRRGGAAADVRHGHRDSRRTPTTFVVGGSRQTWNWGTIPTSRVFRTFAPVRWVTG